MGRLLTNLRPKGGFLPSDLPGLVLWLDAADASTLTLSGTAVSQWGDKSPSANHAIQADAGLQPARVAGERNGLDVVRFNSDFMGCGSAVWTGAAARTMFVVAISRSTGTYADPYVGQGNGVTAGTWFILESRTQFATGDPYLAGNSRDLSGPAPDNAWKVAAATYDGTTAFLYKNGTQVNTGALALNTGNVGFTVGRHVSGATTNYLKNGDVAEAVCYDTVLSLKDRARVHAYLGKKWGVSVFS